MKKFAFAAVIALGFGTAAQAFPLPSTYWAEATDATEVVSTDSLGRPYHRCDGRTSGTAHASCGTLTGGPSGGLF